MWLLDAWLYGLESMEAECSSLIRLLEVENEALSTDGVADLLVLDLAFF
jgi:hypothetical protein